MKASRRARTPSGFSLIEMVVVIVVLGTLATIGSLILTGAFRSYFGEQDSTGADAQAQVALARLSRSLRAVRSASAADLTPGASTLTFTNTSGIVVQYALNATTQTLTRAQNGGSPEVLADHIPQGTFSYWQNDGATPAATAATVYYISAEITVSEGVATATYRTTVHPRNFE